MERTTRTTRTTRNSRIARAGRTPGLLAAAGVAVTALAACGPLQLGAAAIYGSQRITQASLSSESANLTAAYGADQASIQAKVGQLRYSAAQITPMTLTWMLQFAINDQTASREHLTITGTDLNKAQTELTAYARQGNLSLPEFAVYIGLPPDLTPRLVRFQAIDDQLVKKFGGPSSPTAQSGLQKLQCQAAKSMSIQVNPQYGALSYPGLAVLPLPSQLSAPSGSSAPAPKPTSQPAC